MAEHRDDLPTPERREETHDPHNPPNSVLSKEARRAAVRSYFLPVVMLFVIIGLALAFWSTRPARNETEALMTGTSAVGTAGENPGAGGFEPQPGHESTRDELEHRGEDLAPITSIGGIQDVNPQAVRGRRVALEDVDVESASGNLFWVRDERAKVAVIAPAGTNVAAEQQVNVHGTLEPDGQGSVRIRAEQVDVRNK